MLSVRVCGTVRLWPGGAELCCLGVTHGQRRHGAWVSILSSERLRAPSLLTSNPKTVIPFKSAQPCKAECQPARAPSAGCPARALGPMEQKDLPKVPPLPGPGLSQHPLSHPQLMTGLCIPTLPGHILCPLRHVSPRAARVGTEWLAGRCTALPAAGSKATILYLGTESRRSAERAAPHNLPLVGSEGS